jgi:multimeric flavodoxin WrbA
MKILALIGGLRKQNTYDTVKMIEAYHKQYANCEYEYIFLTDIDLKLCTGCHVCVTKGEDFCPLKDDRDMIIKKIEESDGVILASPTFAMNVPWIMTNYMDRLAYIMHRPKFFKQKFMLLTVCGSYRGGKDALKSLSFAVFGGKIINKLIVLNSPGMNENKKAKQAHRIKKEAKKFAYNMNKEYSLKPSFLYLVWFSAFKAISTVYKDEVIADYHFYKDKKYFIDFNLTAKQNRLVNIFTRFFTYLAKKGFV